MNTARPTDRLKGTIRQLGVYAAAKRWGITFTQTKRLGMGASAANVGTALHIAKVEGCTVEELFQ